VPIPYDLESFGFFAADITIDILGSLAGTVHSALAPISTSAGYAAWKIAPTQIPPAGALVGAYHAGAISDEDFTSAVGFLGFSSDPFPGAEIASRAWRSVVAAAKPQLSIQDAVQAYSIGAISRDWYRFVLTRKGFKEDWEASLYDTLAHRPNAMQVQRMQRLGINPPGGIEHWWDLAGMNSPGGKELRQFISLDRHVWTPAECVSLINRGLMDRQDAVRNLHADGFVDVNQRSNVLQLGYDIPTFNDVVDLASYNVFDLGGIGFQELLAEYPNGLQNLVALTGKDAMLNSIAVVPGNAGGVSQAQIDWANHWAKLPVSMAAIIRDRVRPDNIAEWRELYPNIQPFTDDNVRYWAKAAGYHPSIRDQVLAGSYARVNSRQLLWAAEYGNWTRAQLIGVLRSESFAPHDANLLADALQLRVLAMRLPFTEGLWKQQRDRVAYNYVEMFKDNLVTRDQASAGLKDLGMPEDRIPRTLDDAARVKLGEDAIKAQRKLEDLADRTKLQQVDAVIARFKARDMSRALATRQLETLGLRPEQVTEVLNAAVQTERARRATARHEQMQRLRLEATSRHIRAVEESYANGLLLRPVALGLLTQAGLDANTSNALLSSQEAQQNLAEAKRVIAATRSQFLSGSLSQAEALTLLARGGLTPDAAASRILYWRLQVHTRHRVEAAEKVLRWVQKGLLPVAAARQRLLNLGWSEVDAALALAESEATLRSLQSHAIDAAAKRRSSAIAQLSKLQKSHESQVKSLQSRARQVLPRATLAKWYKNGTVGKEYAIKTLIAQGEPKDIAELYIEDWDSGKQPTVRKGSGQVPGAGTVQPTTTNGTQPP